MALDTYANLQTSITTYAMRTGDEAFEAQVPTFIALCESRLNSALRTSDMETVATLTTTGGVADLPADFLQYRAIGDGLRNVNQVSPSFVSDVYGGGTSDATFSIIGGKLYSRSLGHPNLTMVYYAKIPPLSDANPTNWLLAKAPQLYLYGSLLEAMPFGMDDQRMTTWGTLFDRALSDLIKADQLSRYGTANIRVRGATP